MEPSPPNLADLLPSWRLAMRADRKSPATIDSYMRGIRLFIDWCETSGHTPELDRHLLTVWVAELLAGGAEPNTARIRQQAVRRFSAWLAAEGEVDSDPLLGIKPPKLDAKVINGLSDDEIRLLLKACAGKDFLARRDEAVVRLLAETGLRAAECLGLTTDDVNLDRGLVTVRRGKGGKGGKGRIVAIGPQTSAAVDRYVRARKMHRLAGTSALFLGGGDQGLGYHGLRVALLGRARQAGIEGFHLHRMRHSFASRWLAGGGSEGGLMSTAGWSSREMVDRYAKHTAAERAHAEARKLQLGEL